MQTAYLFLLLFWMESYKILPREYTKWVDSRQTLNNLVASWGKPDRLDQKSAVDEIYTWLKHDTRWARVDARVESQSKAILSIWLTPKAKVKLSDLLIVGPQWKRRTYSPDICPGDAGESTLVEDRKGEIIIYESLAYPLYVSEDFAGNIIEITFSKDHPGTKTSRCP